MSIGDYLQHSAANGDWDAGAGMQVQATVKVLTWIVLECEASRPLMGQADG
jgi:catechol-2,3-dioxygenase